MSIAKPISFEAICRRGCIRDTDVKQLRERFYDVDRMPDQEIECLFEINDACKVQDPSWAEFFVEAITDYIVCDTVPEGYLTKENGDWLIGRIARDGTVRTQTELDLLLNVLDHARWSPELLVTFTLEQVKNAVVGGAGPLRTCGFVAPGIVTDRDVELLRRALYAFGGDGNIAITKREAELLFEINDVAGDGDNSPAWSELFVKAIVNHVMAASGYGVPSRQQALERERWLEARGDLSLGAGVGSALKGGLCGILDRYREQSPEERALSRLEQQRIEIITNQEITPCEADWLVERIGRDGELTPNEIALLQCIKATSPTIDPKLAPLLDRVEIAA